MVFLAGSGFVGGASQQVQWRVSAHEIQRPARLYALAMSATLLGSLTLLLILFKPLEAPEKRENR